MAAQWPPRGLKPWDDALKEYVDEIRSDLEPDVTDNTAARHTHANKALLDGIPTGGAWYQTLRRGTAGPEWVDPPGVVIPTFLANFDGDLTALTRDGETSFTSIGPVRYVEGAAPGSQAYVAEEGTTNYARNPVAYNDTAQWFPLGNSTVTRDETVAWSGSASLRIDADGGTSIQGVYQNTASGTAATGETWTVSAMVLFPEGMEFRVLLREALGSFSDTTYTGTGDWQQVQITRELEDEDVTYVQFRIDNNPTQNTAYTAWIGFVQIEKKPYATSFCHGDMGPGYTWAGTAHASASTRQYGWAETSGAVFGAERGAVVTRFRVDTDKGADTQRAIAHVGSDTSRLYLDRNPSGKLQISFGNPATYIIGELIDIGEWVTASVEWDDGTVWLYDSNGTSGQNTYTGFNTAGSVMIGGQQTVAPLDGSVDALAVFDRPLTDAERSHLFNAPTWEWDGIISATHPATILGAFPPNAQAAVGGATLRTAPGTTAPTIDTLTEGTKVHDTGQRITESATDYAYVLTAVGQGYVDESDIIGL